MKPRLSRSLRRILAGVVVVCSQLAQAADMDWMGGYSLPTPNGSAGEHLIRGYTDGSSPLATRTFYPDLASVLDGMDALAAAGGPMADAARDRLAASVAGAGVASLGIAWRTQMENHLRIVRDRIAVMHGGMHCCPPIRDPKAAPVHEPCCMVWANADIDYQNQRGKAELPGFRLNGIGGTVGMSGRLGKDWVLGGALSGMSGRISSKGYGSDASGDLDSYYASIFTRFDHGCWSHSLTLMAGMADVDFHRRVYHQNGAYETKGTPDGLGLAAMYEVAHSFRISDNYWSGAWWQPVFNVAFIHSRMDSFDEEGGDAALSVDKQEYNNVVFGLGARMQALVWRGFLNRDAVFNMRVLGKAMTGHRRGTADVSIAGLENTSRVRTSERGAGGVEVGGGFAVPLGACGGDIFAECTAEFMKNYNSVSGALGYRLSF